MFSMKVNSRGGTEALFQNSEQLRLTQVDPRGQIYSNKEGVEFLVKCNLVLPQVKDSPAEYVYEIFQILYREMAQLRTGLPGVEITE